jgi:hypothetical protein
VLLPLEPAESGAADHDDRRHGGRAWVGQRVYQRKEARMDWKLELIVAPVSDMDRAKEFYFEDGAQVSGPDAKRGDYGTFMSFADPEGTGWMVQEVGRAAAVG